MGCGEADGVEGGTNFVFVTRRDLGECDFDRIRDGQELFEGSFSKFLAEVEDANAIGDFLDLLKKVGGKDDGFAALAQGENEVTNLAGADGVDSGGGFVEE